MGGKLRAMSGALSQSRTLARREPEGAKHRASATLVVRCATTAPLIVASQSPPMEYVVSALGAPKEATRGRRDGYSFLGLSDTPSHSEQPASASIADARRAINSATPFATAKPRGQLAMLDPSWSINGFTIAGMTLAAFKRLAEKAVRKRKDPGQPSTMRTGGPRKAGERLTTADVCFEIIRPATEQLQCAYVELESAVLPGEVGPADAFVSHAWLYDFAELVSALEAANLSPETKFWVDIAVVNQHVNATRGFEWWLSLIHISEPTRPY